MKKLTEEQAWRAVEAAFGRRYGICAVVDDLKISKMIDAKTFSKMNDRIAKQPTFDGIFCWPTVNNLSPDVARQKFARRQSRNAARR